jgi:glycosyltransferase involved in cell wall biosynthesis
MKTRLILVWHEAGNTLYHDRFRELAKFFDLTVLGPRVFRGVDYAAGAQSETGFNLKLFTSYASGHWLTYFSPTMLSYIRANPPQILYIHEEPHSITACLAARLKRRSVFVLESSAINKKGNFSGYNLAERSVYTAVDTIFPKNLEVADVLRARGADPAKMTAPLGNGVSLQSFKPTDKTLAREQLQTLFPEAAKVFTGAMVVGFAGRIWRPKGLETLARAARTARVPLLLCGPVNDPDIAASVQELGAVLLPALNKAQLPLFYAALDLFVLPSEPTSYWREQFGRVCAEAVFCGTPAIGSNVGGIPGVVGREAIFEPSNVYGLAAKIESLKSDAARADLLATQREHIDRNFSWSSIAKRVLSDTALYLK